MGRRPLCLACLLLMLLLWLADLAGIPLVRGNPLPISVQERIAQHPESVICGVVEKSSETEFSQSVYLKETFLVFDSQKVSIKNVRVFLKEEETVPVGTALLVSGKLERVAAPGNPGEFDSRQYYAGQHIYYFMKNGRIKKRSAGCSSWGQKVVELRQRLVNVLETCAGADAGIFEAMLLGEKGNLEEERRLRYQMAGIIHILAISGLHISLLGMGLYRVLMKAGAGCGISGIVSLGVMLGYCYLIGTGVSTLRAVCMFLLWVGAKLTGRIYDMPSALAAAAILLLLDSPACLYGSGFLFSFGAVVGIGLTGPALCDLAGARGKLFRSLLSSLGVQLTTLPVVLLFYGEVSVAGVFLNLLVLPTVPVVLGSGCCGIFAGLVSVRAAAAALLPGRVVLYVYEGLCGLAGVLPWGVWIGGAPKIWQVAVYYAVLGVVIFAGRMAGKGKAKGVRLVRKPLGCAAALAAAVWILAWHPCRNLAVTCLDVGQGDAIVLAVPGNHYFLIDGGSSSRSQAGRYQILPYLKSQGISRLDAIFVSHTDQDHISGIQELLEYMGEGLTAVRAGVLILPQWQEETEACLELRRLADLAGVPVRTGCAGDSVRAGEACFSFLSPEKGCAGTDVNEDGIVLELSYRGFHGLFTGDIGEETEKKLLSLLEDVDFLKVAHHGSRYSSSEAFLEKICPEIGFISCSDSNTYGHPSPEAVERLEAAGCRLEYTMKSGAVTVRTDGKRIFVERFCRRKA